jgi:hypothetical protein
MPLLFHMSTALPRGPEDLGRTLAMWFSITDVSFLLPFPLRIPISLERLFALISPFYRKEFRRKFGLVFSRPFERDNKIPPGALLFPERGRDVPRLTFPEPGVARSHHVELPNSRPFALWVKFHVGKAIDPHVDPYARYYDERYYDEPSRRFEPSGFCVAPLEANDSLSLISVGPNLVMGNIWHKDRVTARECIVRCADGKSSQTCVTCWHGDVTVKICC